VLGLLAFCVFSFDSPDALAYKTLITQKIFTKGYFAYSLIFSSLTHTPELVDGYFGALDPTFSLVKQCQEGVR
jgi:glutamate-1-semialdehyde 2,1-aminomutase